MNYGAIRLSSNPSGATVSISGQVKGTAPLDIVNTTPGIYNITLSYPGMESYNFDTAVVDGSMTVVYFDFAHQEATEKHIQLTGEDLVSISPPPGLTEEEPANAPPGYSQNINSGKDVNTETSILNSLNDIKSLLQQLVQQNSDSSDEKNTTSKFDTGIQTLGAAVLNIPAPEDVSVTGYTRVAIWDVLGRLSQNIYLINQGPGTIFIRKSNDGSAFSAVEIPVFAGEKGTFNNLYEVRIRSDLTGTRYRVTEHESNLIINNFDDRVATAAHISGFANLAAGSGFTTLANYTVPTGYKAKVNGVRVRIAITTAAVVPDFRQINIVINNPTLGLFSMIGATIGADHNAVGFNNEAQLGYAYTLLAGESVEIDVEDDTSTGGNVDYYGSVEITQYFSYPT